MPSTVNQLFAAAGLLPEGPVRWGQRVPAGGPGAYAVSLTSDPDDLTAALPTPQISESAIADWLAASPMLRVDGRTPSVRDIIERMMEFWLPDEVALYIGLATTLSSRVNAYYRTPLGARRPHSGGYFLKTLANLGDLWVFYATHPRPAEAEGLMLSSYCDGVSASTKAVLRDPAHPFPFANLEWPPGTRKLHGIRGARSAAPHRRREFTPPPSVGISTANVSSAGQGRTQRVTGGDRSAGQIRIPSSGAAPTKSLFPPDKAHVEVVLRGHSFIAPWDPRMGPDKERSGVLRIGPRLRDLVQTDEVLTVTTSGDGAMVID